MYTYIYIHYNMALANKGTYNLETPGAPPRDSLTNNMNISSAADATKIEVGRCKPKRWLDSCNSKNELFTGA